jgi:hypothetical protein
MTMISRSVVLVAATTASAWLAASSCSSTSSGGAAPSVDASVDGSMMAVDSGTDVATPLGDAVTADSPVGDGGCPTDGGIPDDLYCTGLYGDWATKTIAADAIPYTPGLVFWSDGAVKTRWIYLPPGSQIDTSDPDDWTFPVGTKIWKQFVVDGALVETRLIWKTDSLDWTYLDYRWSADASTATLLTQGETNVNGTTYEIPATNKCEVCHQGRNDVVLGFDFIGLGVVGAEGVTLATLTAAGQLTQPLPATSVTIPEDSTGKAAAALGWLHVNCGSSCHNTNVTSGAIQTHLYMKLLAAELYPEGGAGQVAHLDTYTTAVNVLSIVTPGGVEYARIAPGDAGASLMPLMDLARGDASIFNPMPPLVSHIPDEAGVALVQAWIQALPP